MRIKENLGIIVLAIVIILTMLASFIGIIDNTLGMTIAFMLFLVFTIIVALNAKKNDVKIIEGLMILFGVITLVIIVSSIRAYILKHNIATYKFQIVVEEATTDKTLLFNYNNHNYYTYNLSNVSVIMEDTQEKYSLEDALTKGYITLNEILGLAAKDSNTDGYELYYDAGQKKYDNDEYSIVVCDNENLDVIFSTFSYKYSQEICE